MQTPATLIRTCFAFSWRLLNSQSITKTTRIFSTSKSVRRRKICFLVSMVEQVIIKWSKVKKNVIEVNRVFCKLYTKKLFKYKIYIFCYVCVVQILQLSKSCQISFNIHYGAEPPKNTRLIYFSIYQTGFTALY